MPPCVCVCACVLAGLLAYNFIFLHWLLCKDEGVCHILSLHRQSKLWDTREADFLLIFYSYIVVVLILFQFNQPLSELF